MLKNLYYFRFVSNQSHLISQNFFFLVKKFVKSNFLIQTNIQKYFVLLQIVFTEQFTYVFYFTKFPLSFISDITYLKN